MYRSINTFGCSWTAGPSGLLSDFPWPLMLADKLENIQVNNWARGGSNIAFQSYVLDSFCQNIKKPDDIIIFQITSHDRFSYWDADLHKNFNQMKEKWSYKNYTHYTLDYSTNFGNITAGDLDSGYSWIVIKNRENMLKEKNTFAKEYYKRIGLSQSLFNHMLYINYIIPKVDFIYFHIKHPKNFPKKYPNFIKNKYENIPCVKDMLGNEEYNKYVIDDGQHLSKEGNDIVANLILKNIKHLL